MTIFLIYDVMKYTIKIEIDIKKDLFLITIFDAIKIALQNYGEIKEIDFRKDYFESVGEIVDRQNLTKSKSR